MNPLSTVYSKATFVAVVGAASISVAAHADAVSDFYSGKQITIAVGFGAGGGYDTTTRIMARHFAQHIPGNPTIVVQNMPGGGSMKLANYLYNAAPKDGTFLGVISASISLEPLFGNKKAKFDTLKFQWIGSLHRETLACGVWKKANTGVNTLEDLIKSKKTIIFGATSAGSPTSQHVVFLKNMFGANVKVVTGYKGTKGVNLAMQRGEVDGTCGMFESAITGPYARDVKSGDLILFTQFGHEKRPVFGNATMMYDHLKSDDDRKIADLIFRQSVLARPLTAPPDTPKERVAALRQALLATMHDRELIKDAKKIKVTFNPVPGAEVTQIFRDFLSTPPDLVKKTRQITNLKK